MITNIHPSITVTLWTLKRAEINNSGEGVGRLRKGKVTVNITTASPVTSAKIKAERQQKVILGLR